MFYLIWQKPLTQSLISCKFMVMLLPGVVWMQQQDDDSPVHSHHYTSEPTQSSCLSETGLSDLQIINQL